MRNAVACYALPWFRGKSLKIFAFATVCAMPFGPAFAYTECTLNIQRMFSGDNGYVWLHFTNGGSAYFVPTDPDIATTTAFGMTALAGGRTVTIRYSADGVACTSTGRSDAIGLYLN